MPVPVPVPSARLDEVPTLKDNSLSCWYTPLVENVKLVSAFVIRIT